MAKKSMIAKNEQRKEIVARYAERRAELKKIIKNPNSTDEERLDAQWELNRQPRDASPVRVRNRDAADGRPRGYLRKFGLSRVRVRNMAHRGEPCCGHVHGTGRTYAGSRAGGHQLHRGYGRELGKRRGADGSAPTVHPGAPRRCCSGS